MVGQPGLARLRLTTALTLASQAGDKRQRARAHHGLARGYEATGDPDQASSHWREALAIYAELGAPEADQVQARLTAAASR